MTAYTIPPNVVEEAVRVSRARMGGEPEREGPGWAWWPDGSWWRCLRSPLSVALGRRIARGVPTWVLLARDPEGEAWRRDEDAEPPRFAISEEGEALDLEGEEEVEAIRTLYRSGAYFLSQVDMTRVTKAKAPKAGAQTVAVCELCLAPFAQGDRYVRRQHKQSGDGRRSHFGCAQRAVEAARRGGL